jgi:hypothetical protein
MIGSILYVMASRPNVMSAVGQAARFQVARKETHVLAVKRIFIYLKGTIDFWLWYPKGNELIMVSYMDSYWEGIIYDKRSTCGETFYLGDYTTPDC